MLAADELAKLKATFRSHGWYERPTSRVVLELSYHLAVFLAGLALMVVASSLGVKGLGLLLVTGGLLGVATNTHTSAHYATSRKRWLNELLTYFGYPFFLQVSATYWWDKHNMRHHLNANVLEMDADIDLSPWFALTERCIATATANRRWYYRKQWIVFPIALACNSFVIQVSGWHHVIASLMDKGRRNTTHMIDLAVLLLHWTVWILIPALFFPLHSVAAFHWARAVTMSYALFAVIAPCHYPAEARLLTKKERAELDFVARQTVTAVNFRTGCLGTLMCSGLQYHIEHHLFPNMCHVYYPAASKLVHKYCDDHQLSVSHVRMGRSGVEGVPESSASEGVRRSTGGFRFTSQ
jgi:linoleoyl-CoA desaturase